MFSVSVFFYFRKSRKPILLPPTLFQNIIAAKETDTGTKYGSSSAVFSRLQDESAKANSGDSKAKQPKESKRPQDARQLRL